MAVEKAMGSSSLVEVIDRVLDKGIVVDAWVRVSLVGIELLAIEARIVVASVETWLKYAEAVGLTAEAAEAYSPVVPQRQWARPSAGLAGPGSLASADIRDSDEGDD